MGAARTIRRVASALGCVALLGACHAGGKPPKRRTPGAPSAFASAGLAEGTGERPRPAASAAPRPSAIVQTLSALRAHRLAIAAPTAPSELLAFGSHRLVQASLDKATFRDSKDGQVVAEASIGTVRAVAHGPDGTLFAIGSSSSALLEPRMKATKRFPHVTFLPDSRLLPDLEGPSHFYVYYPEGAQLNLYPLSRASDSVLPIEAIFHLDGCGEPMTQLRDGAIVCRSVTGTGFLRQAPRGSRAEFAAPSGVISDDPLLRLLPGMRLDEFFAITRSGAVFHLRVAENLLLLASFRLPAPAYAVAANTEALAFVLVTEPDSEQPRRWSLLVTDHDGRPRFEQELPSRAPGADEDWLAAVAEDKNLAISGFEPLVAVGGPRRVTVWDYQQTRELFTR
ncbi:MAG TPA: hypothetical protein VER96_31985 [Polyangiaceae bacterium]|nr:hypothetical protein [Polyangiaceae bacterium]